jgi:hypothetical protein
MAVAIASALADVMAAASATMWMSMR